jgi:uncharacterized lipoprotein YddW (UPF0748 family)
MRHFIFEWNFVEMDMQVTRRAVKLWSALFGKLFLSLAMMAASFAHGLVIDSMGDDSGWVELSPISADTEGSGGKVNFACSFSQGADGSRCVWDKVYNVDVSSFNAIKLKLNVQDAASLSSMGYYLELPSTTLDPLNPTVVGWHVSGPVVPLVEGEQESVLAFSNLREATCAGSYCYPIKDFTALTKIRLSPWKKPGSQQDALFTVDSIEAFNIPVAVVGDDNSVTGAITSILARYHIDYVVVPKAQLTGSLSAVRNPLRGIKLVIANSATLNSTQADFIASHLSANSAKMIAFGPQVLAGTTLRQALGVQTPGGGTLNNVTGISFVKDGAGATVLGLPDTTAAVYGSVAISAFSASAPATAIGYWVYPGSSNPGGVAWQLNSIGAYRDRVLLANYHQQDEDRVLLALMLQLRPDMTDDIVEGVFAATNSFANETSFSAALANIESALQVQPPNELSDHAADMLVLADQFYDDAVLSGTTTPFTTLGALFSAREALGEAYAVLNSPLEGSEMRAVWSHSGLGAYPGNWEASIDYAATYGFNTFISNVARASSVTYNSQENFCAGETPVAGQPLCVQRSTQWPNPLTFMDPLQESIDEAHAAGMQLIAWKLAFSLGVSTPNNVNWWRASGFMQREYVSGSYVNSASAVTPCAQEVRDLDFDVLEEIASDYNVDGIHLDYIRFNSENSSYDTHCKAAFKTYLVNNNYATGPDPLLPQCIDPDEDGDDTLWPKSSNHAAAGNNPACVAVYQVFLRSVITDHVERIRIMIDGVNASRPSTKPEIKLSAAVFAVANESVRQDWPAWANAQLLDYAFPMTYAASLPEFKSLVLGAADQVRIGNSVDTTIPLYFGLGGYRTHSDGIVTQIEWLRSTNELPAERGFSFFEFSEDSIVNMLPQVAKSVMFLDEDDDGVRDGIDNCPATANPAQTDIDGDDVGDACQHGLTASYFNDSDTNSTGVITEVDDKLVLPWVLQRIDDSIDLNWGMGSPEYGTIMSDYFSARWTGRLLVPAYTGTYEFCLTGDDGFRLWIDGVDIFGNAYWKPQDFEGDCASVNLTAGQVVPIKVEFFDLTEHAILELTWSWPGQAAHVVPKASFYAE